MAAARSTEWDERRVQRELQSFLAGSGEWPSYREFVRAGRKRLRDEVTRLGGASRWAARVGVRYVERKPGYPSRWTESRIKRELQEFLTGRRTWPARVEFECAGRKALRDAVARTGGVQRWASVVDVRPRDRRAGSKRAWSPQRIETECAPLLRGRQDWPARAEFEDAGLSSALSAMYRFEGIAYWRRRFGFTAEQARRQPPNRLIWTEMRIETELRRFCGGRATWPAAREFEEAGQGRLYRAASRNGGIERWARQLRLSRPGAPGRRRSEAGRQTPSSGSGRAAPRRRVEG